MTFPDACPLCGAPLRIWGDEARCKGCGVGVGEIKPVLTPEERRARFYVVKEPEPVEVRKDVL